MWSPALKLLASMWGPEWAHIVTIVKLHLPQVAWWITMRYITRWRVQGRFTGVIITSPETKCSVKWSPLCICNRWTEWHFHFSLPWNTKWNDDLNDKYTNNKHGVSRQEKTIHQEYHIGAIWMRALILHEAQQRLQLYWVTVIMIAPTIVFNDTKPKRDWAGVIQLFWGIKKRLTMSRDLKM